ADYASLIYTDWETWSRTLGNPPGTVGQDAVLHLKTDDIYIDIKFLSWSVRIGGGFSYSRSTASGMNMPPTVAITNPPNGVVMTSPTNGTLEAAASDPDGTVASVQFFD